MLKRVRASTVVVIDDNPRERATAAALLSGHGYRVRSSADANEGMDQIRAGGAAVVVLGLGRKWQVLDLIRRLRGRFEAIPLREQPRIVVTAGAIDEASERFTRRLGADVILRKPLEETQLARVVGELARRSAPQAPTAIYESA
jgi:CheY-like chemotaxis protein